MKTGVLRVNFSLACLLCFGQVKLEKVLYKVLISLKRN